MYNARDLRDEAMKITDGKGVELIGQNVHDRSKRFGLTRAKKVPGYQLGATLTVTRRRKIKGSDAHLRRPLAVP